MLSRPEARGTAGFAAGTGAGFPVNLPRDAAATDLEETDVDLTFATSAMDGRRERKERIERAVVFGERGEADVIVGTGGWLTGSSG
jgi:hypothetical protein